MILKKKILILGSKGMLGKALMNELADLNPVGLDREDFDISNNDQLKEVIIKFEPEVIFNCAAFTDVNAAEENFHFAELVNGYAVGLLARLCREYDITLVHFSTDYVFNGLKNEGYSEDALPDPINAYGKSKLVGENLLEEEMQCENALDELEEGKYFLIRISYLFSAIDENNIVMKFYKKLLSGEHLNLVSDQRFKLTYAPDLAEKVSQIVLTSEFDYGTYHLTNEGDLSWVDLVSYLAEKLNITPSIANIENDTFNAKVKRPKYSILKNTKVSEMRNWQIAVDDFLLNLGKKKSRD